MTLFGLRHYKIEIDVVKYYSYSTFDKKINLVTCGWILQIHGHLPKTFMELATTIK